MAATGILDRPEVITTGRLVHVTSLTTEPGTGRRLAMTICFTDKPCLLVFLLFHTPSYLT